MSFPRAVFQLQHYWHFGPDNSLLWGMFSSIPGLYPYRDANSTPLPSPLNTAPPSSIIGKNDSAIIQYPLGENCLRLRTTTSGTASSYAEKTPKQSRREARIAKNWGLPKPCKAAILEVALPASVKPSDDCSQLRPASWLHPHERLWARTTQHPAPQFLTHKNCEIINLV